MNGRLEFKDDKSQKFWEYKVSGTEVTITYGKIGTEGRIDEKCFVTEADAISFAEKKRDEKIKKGYQKMDDPHELESSKQNDNKSFKKRNGRPKAVIDGIEASNFKKVENEFLETDIHPNDIKDQYDNYALEYACNGYQANEERYKIAELLLEKGADPNLGRFFTYLCYSYSDNPWHLKTIDLLLKNGIDLHLIGKSDGATPLQGACNSALVSIVKQSLSDGVDANRRTMQGHNALHYVGLSQSKKTDELIEIIDLLLAAGVDMHAEANHGDKPIHYSTTRNEKKVFEHFLKKGAVIDIKVLENAARWSDPGIFQLLLESDHIFQETDYEDIAKWILGSLGDYRLPIAQNALHRLKLLSDRISISKMNGQKVCASFLKELGKKKKLNPDESKILLQLPKLGYNPWWQDEERNTLVHFAAKFGEESLLQSCMDSTDQKHMVSNNKGETPLDMAKNKAIAKMLNKAFPEAISAIPKESESMSFAPKILEGTEDDPSYADLENKAKQKKRMLPDSNIENAEYLKALRYIESENWEALEPLMDKIQNEWRDLVNNNTNEASAFLNALAEKWSFIKESDYEVEFCWKLLSLGSGFQDETDNCPGAFNEKIVREWSYVIWDNANDGDAFSKGYAYALELFPQSDDILGELLNQIIDQDYLCEDAIIGAVQHCLTEERKQFLQSLNLLASYATNLSHSSSEDALKYLLRDLEWIKESYPNFSKLHLQHAMAYIDSQPNLSDWQYPSVDQLAEVDVLFELFEG